MKQKLLALAFAFLMLASTMPAAEARHIDGITPDAPTLPRAQPTQRCVGTSVDPTILARVNDLVQGDPAWYQTDVGAPALCLNGEPITPYQNLILQLDAMLRDLQNTSTFIQRQVDRRLEDTLPPSDYPNELVEPRTVLLEEGFDGRRTTGFGDWKVVTQAGEPAAFQLLPVTDKNGTRNVYSFGDADGYARGAHQWLVSPEIDLTALKGNQTAIQDLVYARDYAQGRMRFLCNDYAFPQAQTNAGMLRSICGDDPDPTINLTGQPTPIRRISAIVQAYETAFNETIMKQPVMQHAAFLDISYRVNMLEGEDGVRMWIYTGERQPDRSVLFDERFDDARRYEWCAHRNADVAPGEAYRPVNSTLSADSEANDLECVPRLDGGEVVTSAHSGELRNLSEVKSFRTAANGAANVGFTGFTDGFHKARINLTDLFGQRVWILFEAKTLPDERGEDVFSDETRFRELRDFGFALGSVYAEGDGYHRNVRLKAVGATYDFVQPANDFGDPTTVRTTLPHGNDPVVVWVHNAGDYLENATLRVSARGGGDFTTNLTIKPDQVLPVAVKWGELTAPEGSPPKDRALYTIEATLSVLEQDLRGANANEQLRQPTNVTGYPALDPNTTRARPINAASQPTLGAGVLEIDQDIRVAHLRNLTAVRADGLSGVPLQVCSDVDVRTCTEHYAGKKGEPRIVLAGIRNDGNAPQDVRVRLSVQLDGLSKEDVILQGAERTLLDVAPGEIRPVQFTLVPNDPGAYQLILTMFREGEEAAVEKNVERLMFVQRSTGLICLDAISERECGPSFQGGLEPALKGQNITAAAIAADGTLFVATTIAEPNETGVESGMLAMREPSGTWRELVNLSSARLRDRIGDAGVDANGETLPWGQVRDIVLTDDSIYLVGDHLMVLKLNASGLHRVDVHADLQNLTAGVWHNGTLLVAGHNGTLAQLVANGSMAAFRVEAPVVVDEDTTEMRAYLGNFTDLAHDAQGSILLIGQHGYVGRHAATGDLSDGWAFVDLGIGAHLASLSRIGNETWIAGEGIILYNRSGEPTGFVRASLPPSAGGPMSYRKVFAAHDGGIFVLDTASRLATCQDCRNATTTWEYPLLARPSVEIPPRPVHLASIDLALADDARTILLGEAGAILERVFGGTYSNDREWTVTPSLLAHDNGVLQTRRHGVEAQYPDRNDVFIGIPTGAGQDAAARATEFRLFLTHHIDHVNNDTVGPDEPGGAIRLLYRDVRALRAQSFELCPPQGTKDNTTQYKERVCNSDVVRYPVASFYEPTRVADWVHRFYEDLPSSQTVQNPAGGQNATSSAYLAGIEIAIRGQTMRWAIDDLRLEGLVGGEWVTVLSWEGLPEPGEDHRNGTWQRVSFTNMMQPYVDMTTQPRADANEVARNATDEVETTEEFPRPNLVNENVVQSTLDDSSTWQPAWEEWYFPYEELTASPWHVTTSYADAPVFAANNEFFPGDSEPARPVLKDRWNARLVSPVIDLTEAYDPTISFRHVFSFRTRFYEVEDPKTKIKSPVVAPLDGGVLEVQYQLQGAECGARSDDVKCGWSPFYVVPPMDGYPGRDDLGLADVGLVGNNPTTLNTAIGKRIGENISFWGRGAAPDISGTITKPRFTEEYEEVRVALKDAICATTDQRQMLMDYVPGLDLVGKDKLDCLPVDVTGRQIRFAFHLMTAGDFKSYTDRTLNAPYHTGDGGADFSRPGEGWYISDFKVLGARTLGIDLRATNMSFPVGYDVDTIGVGPGTTVPVNVTIQNRGAFDVLGYTGVLEVRRVVDRARQITELVDTIPLTQQPVLPMEQPESDAHQRNHTLDWTVPAIEGAEYALTFTVVPLGIAEDEDDRDNVARLGTIADPILARTVRRVVSEFAVSPENATIDLVRFVPMFVNNTGNVPAESLVVERRITMIGVSVQDEAEDCAEWRQYKAQGRRTAIVECRSWNMTAPAPAGTRSPITLLSGEVSASTDLYWQAPERASYLATVIVRSKDGLTAPSAMEKRISAFATYLFDNVEGGPRGEAMSGEWIPGQGWGIAQPGFRASPDAWGFGDGATGRYPADSNATLAMPTIDIGTARTAQVAFFHSFAFEPGFDGGLIEASTDGGATWTPLVPLSDELSSAGYNASFPVQPTSVLHPTGDPIDESFAFTSNSSLLPSSVDSWVLTQVDLTQLDAVSEAAPYEAFGAGELSGYAGSLPTLREPAGLWRGETWCPGGASDRGCWEYDNISSNITSPVPPARGETENTFWWSGSPNLQDDQRRPIQNQLLEIPVEIGNIADDQLVTAEWWEYSTRLFGKSTLLFAGRGTVSPDAVMTHHTFHSDKTVATTYRYNLSEPVIVEKEGRWMRMQADITPLVKQARAKGETSMLVAFSYAPLTEYSSQIDDKVAINERPTDAEILAAEQQEYAGGGGQYGAWVDDVGFAIDNFTILTTQFSNGQPVGRPTPILTEDEAWTNRALYDCGRGFADRKTETNTANTNNWAAPNSAFPACFDESLTGFLRYKNLLFESDSDAGIGRVWSRVPSMPGAPAGWTVVPITDHAGHHAGKLTPFGDAPHAFYSGNPLWNKDELDTNSFCAPGAGCLEPGGESRLITPVFDLGRVSGSDARLEFWHRYAFYAYNYGEGGVPFASGGVVEISEYRPETGTWSEWEQIYSKPKALDIGGLSAFNLSTGDFRGGYPAVTGNVSVGSDGVRRFDAPFDNIVAPDRDDTVVQYLYSGRSDHVEVNSLEYNDGNELDGWIRESYDVSDRLGKRVRFGFHYSVAPFASASQNVVAGAYDPVNGGPRVAGWWISDVELVGDVLTGQPVQLRLRAGTDGNVNEGHWRIDDIGAFGSRYASNVGLFVDPEPNTFGAYPLGNTTVPVTVRNLGTTVRRDLAVEVSLYDATGIDLNLTAPGATVEYPDPGMLRITGITLPPGAATTIHLNVRAPASFAEKTVKLVFETKQLDPNGEYVTLAGNEVAGLLSRIVDFHLQPRPAVEIGRAAIQQARAVLGEPVEMALEVANDGFSPAELNFTCTARTIVGWDPGIHRSGQDHREIVAATYPCELVGGDTTLDAKQRTQLVYSATPTEAGYLQFRIQANVVDGAEKKVSGGIAVGVPLTTYTTGFDLREEIEDNWTQPNPNALGWSHLRGHDAPGALYIGQNENFTDAGYAALCGYRTPCIVRSPVIDLHNYTKESPAYLSFWHLDRMAKWDGAQIRARVLEDETRPSSGWSKPCILFPVTGYEGVIKQDNVGNNGDQTPAGQDHNPVFENETQYPDTQGNNGNIPTAPDFFVSPNGQWQENWEFALFDLSQNCLSVSTRLPWENQTLVGHKVQFQFELYPGSAPSPFENGQTLRRGIGQGIYFDDIKVGPLALAVGPVDGQRAVLMDNTTKGFHVLVENLAAAADVVRLEFDALNSSAPEGSITVPDQDIVLAAGETKLVRVNVTLPRDPSLLPTEFTARIIARSTIDPQAVGVTTLELVFGPRQWSELGLTVEAPTGIVQEGTRAFIPITVENTGLVTSPATVLRVIDEWEGGRVERTLDVPRIPSYQESPDAASAVIEFEWLPEAGSVGPHTLSFEIDPAGLVEEYTKGNNLATIAVPVSDLLVPDLYVSNFSALAIRNAAGARLTAAFDADVARYEVTAGELVTFELRVANRGRSGATNVDVRALVGELSLPSKTIPFIAPGSEAIVTFNWPAQKGEHEVEFLVRSEQVEITTANNRYPGTGVTILTVKGYEIAIDITVPTSLLEAGTEVKLPFTVTNNGNAGEDLMLRATTPKGMQLRLPREGFFLRAGETYEGEASLFLEAEAVAGEQLISIDAIARENPMKVALGRAAVQVNATYAGSAAGGIAVGAPPSLVLPIELVNEGNSLEPWTVTLQLPAGWVPKEKLPLQVVVPAHDRKVVDLHLTIPESTAPGDRVVSITAKMPNGETRLAVARVSILPLRAADVTVDVATPSAERGALSVPITVVNTGNVKQPFSLLLLDAPEGVEMSVQPAKFDLAPGASATAQLLVKPNASVEAGTYAIGGYTLFDGVVPETTEGLLNVQTLRVPIVRQDLVLSPLEYAPRSGIEAGDRVSVKVVVQNRGLGELKDVPVHLFVDDVFIDEVRIAALPAGGRADVTFNWTALTGVHTLTAVVDPYEDTVDADRADNAVSALASVGTDVPTGGLAAGRADTPAPGLFGLLAALAVAVLLARGNGSRRQRR